MFSPRQKRKFTLLEVAVALAVLGFSLGLFLELIGGARDRLVRAETRWANQHLLTQAAELYLLGGPKAEIPSGAFPPNFNATCSLAKTENLPDDANTAVSGGWILGTYEISVTGLRNQEIGKLTVEKMVQEIDL